ncbi:unnamed protein product [Rotaria magnacalcarata]|nr:unnamed protein product [Rotaria magnacalcarata]
MSSAKHIMLSYQWDSQAIVTDVYRRLRAYNIPLWMDTQGGMKGDLSTSMAEGVENAVALCCFLTPKYQDSVACKDELTYAKEQRVCIIPIRLMKDWKPTGWLGFSITGHKWIDFRDIATNMDLRINQLIAEIQMLAGDKLSSIKDIRITHNDVGNKDFDKVDDGSVFHCNEEENKQNEENSNAPTVEEIELGKRIFVANAYYRLTTRWQSDGKSLDIVNDGKNNNQIILAKTGNYSGQHWKITLVEDGYYRLTTQWQGDDKSLDIVNDGKNNNRIILAKSSNCSGQYWRINLLANNYYRITSKWQGYDKSLDVVNDGENNKLILATTGNYSGQYWKITRT